MQNPNGWFHVDLGNVITWSCLAIVWLINRGMDSRGLNDRMTWMEKWQEGHQEEAAKRNELITELSKTTAVLTKLTDIAERRLERLEGDK